MYRAFFFGSGAEHPPFHVRPMQPQSGKEDSGSGLGSPEDNDILLEEETSELPKSIPGRIDGLVDFMSNLDVSHVGGARGSKIRELV